MNEKSTLSNEHELREEVAGFASELFDLANNEQSSLPEIAEKTINFAKKLVSPEMLYKPRDELVSRLQDYRQWLNTRENEDAGILMEQIAYLAFTSLRDYDAVSNYRSFDAQLDLVISGSGYYWLCLIEMLHLPSLGRSIVIEAKNIEDAVSNSQFLRLCGIVQNKLSGTCHLGVFVTRNGASGFDEVNKLSNARASQVIFHAATQKSVIVLTHSDLILLDQPGALPQILERKIREVEEAKGIPGHYDGPWEVESTLPNHLSRYEQRNS